MVQFTIFMAKSGNTVWRQTDPAYVTRNEMFFRAVFEVRGQLIMKRIMHTKIERQRQNLLTQDESMFTCV